MQKPIELVPQLGSIIWQSYGIDWYHRMGIVIPVQERLCKMHMGRIIMPKISHWAKWGIDKRPLWVCDFKQMLEWNYFSYPFLVQGLYTLNKLYRKPWLKLSREYCYEVAFENDNNRIIRFGQICHKNRRIMKIGQYVRWGKIWYATRRMLWWEAMYWPEVKKVLLKYAHRMVVPKDPAWVDVEPMKQRYRGKLRWGECENRRRLEALQKGIYLEPGEGIPDYLLAELSDNPEPVTEEEIAKEDCDIEGESLGLEDGDDE